MKVKVYPALLLVDVLGLELSTLILLIGQGALELQFGNKVFLDQ